MTCRKFFLKKFPVRLISIVISDTQANWRCGHCFFVVWDTMPKCPETSLFPEEATRLREYPYNKKIKYLCKREYPYNKKIKYLCK